MDQKQAQFAALAAEAAGCTRCPAMCERSAVLSELNGSIEASVLFIGEAPGHKGADRTRIPFSGDQSGRNFSRYLDSIGLARDKIFITNAVLCNPRNARGGNRRPRGSEIANCSNFLKRQIDLIDAKVLVTLGVVALEALKRIEYHQLLLKENAGTIVEWYGRWLVPLYHPSPHVLAASRNEESQLSDYKAVAHAIAAMD